MQFISNNLCRRSAIKEEEHNAHGFCVGCMCDFLSKSPWWKGGLESNLMVEKSDKYHLSQLTKPMSTVMTPIDGMYLWYDMVK